MHPLPFYKEKHSPIQNNRIEQEIYHMKRFPKIVPGSSTDIISIKELKKPQAQATAQTRAEPVTEDPPRLKERRASDAQQLPESFIRRVDRPLKPRSDAASARAFKYKVYCLLICVCAVIAFNSGDAIRLLAMIPLLLTIWLILFDFPEVALAVQLIGFDIYPLLSKWLGLATSSNTTLLYYSFLALAYSASMLIRYGPQVRKVIEKRVMLLLGSLCLLMTLSWLVYSFESEFAAKKVAFLYLLVLPSIICIQCLTAAQVYRFFMTVMAIGAAYLFVVIVGLWRDDYAGLTRIAIVNHGDDVLNNPLSLGYAAALASLLMLVRLKKRGNYFLQLGVASGAVLIGIYFVVASGSRGPLVAFACGIIVILLAFKPLRPVLLGALGAALLTGLTFDAILPASPLERVMLLVNTDFSDSEQLGVASANRSLLWQNALETWVSNPLIGVGMGNSRVLEDMGELRAGERIHFHNAFLEVAAEFGLAGLSMFVAFFTIVLRAAYQIRHNDTFISMAAILSLVCGISFMLFSGEIESSVGFWMPSGLILMLRQQATWNHARQ
jgi:O-antigen ligase